MTFKDLTKGLEFRTRGGLRTAPLDEAARTADVSRIRAKQEFLTTLRDGGFAEGTMVEYGGPTGCTRARITKTELTGRYFEITVEGERRFTWTLEDPNGFGFNNPTVVVRKEGNVFHISLPWLGDFAVAPKGVEIPTNDNQL